MIRSELFISLGMILVILSACRGSAPEPTPLKPTATLKPTVPPTQEPMATLKPTIIPTLEPIKILENRILYLVQAGDTLGAIAEKFNVSPEALARSNHLDQKNPSITAGEYLSISCIQTCSCMLPGLQTNMPPYYRFHPALTWIAPISPKHIPSLRWIDNTHFAISKPWQGNFECRIVPWDVYELPNTSSGIIEPQNVLTETIGCATPTPEPVLTWLNTILGEQDFDLYVAPDGNKAITLIKTDKPKAILRIGEGNEPPGGLFDQVWLVNLSTQEARPLFFTSIGYYYEWAQDSRFLIMTWDCLESDPASAGAFITFDTVESYKLVPPAL